MQKIKISFVLPNLRAGGAERVMSFIAQKLDESKFDVTLVVIGLSNEQAYDISGIKVVFFNKPRVLSGIKELFGHIKNQKPHVVFGAIGHLNTVIAYMSWLFPKTKFVAREVNVLSVLATFDKPKRLNIMGFIGKHRFNRFDKIICQSSDMLDDLNKSYKIKQSKLVVINNPITSGFSLKSNNKRSDPIKFITVARLVKQKGHIRIIEALGKINFPFTYTIIGDGPLKKPLFDRAKELGFYDQITNIPFTKNVAKYLSESDLYLQGSYVEGFPNAIIESCMVGTPILAYNAPGGINEIIVEGINGYVEDGQKGFVYQLNKINSEYLFIPRNVSHSVSSRYSEDIIIKKYEDLFLKLVNQS